MKKRKDLTKTLDWYVILNHLVTCSINTTCLANMLFIYSNLNLITVVCGSHAVLL